MVKVVCEKSGLEFEARTSRTKNHPQIMNIVNDASKDGWYRDALSALEEYKGKFQTVEQYIELLDTVKQAHEDKVSAQWKAKVQDKFAAREAAREKAIQDAKLERAGYHFERVVVADDGEDFSYGMELIAPDGAPVTVKQALAEIENPALVEDRLNAAKREIVSEIDARGHEVGDFVTIVNSDDPERILVVVATDAHTAEVAIPNEQEQQDPRYLAIKKRIDEERAHQKMMSDSWRKQHEQRQDNWNCESEVDPWLLDILAGVSDN